MKRRKIVYGILGLKQQAFENALDIKMFYSSPMHEEALMRMVYVINERQGAGMLTGDYGSGKTILTRILATQLNTNENKFVFINNPQLEAVELLKEIVRQVAVVDRIRRKRATCLIF